MTFYSEGGLLLKTPAHVDSALVMYINQLYMGGRAASRGCKDFPEYPRAGNHHLPRTARAFQNKSQTKQNEQCFVRWSCGKLRQGR